MLYLLTVIFFYRFLKSAILSRTNQPRPNPLITRLQVVLRMSIHPGKQVLQID